MHASDYAILFGNIIEALIYFSVTIWVVIDTKKIGVKKGVAKGLGNMGRAGWIISTIFLWILAVPIYLFNREKYIAANELDISGSAQQVVLGLYILVVLWVIVSIYINITGGVDTTAYHGYLKSSPERTNTESNINNNSNNNENTDSNSNNVSVGGNRNNNYGGLSSTVTTINKPHIHYFGSDSNTSVIPLGALGTLSIDRHGMGMNGAGHTIKMDEPMGPLDFYAVVSVNNSNFYIVRSIGGTACPGLFSVVYLNNHWRFVSTKEFGTCATRTKITATAKKIFFSMYTNGDEKKIYTFNLPKQIRHSATRYVPAQPAESKDHELKSKLIKVTNTLTNDYNKILGEYNPASDRKIKNAEINWIIQKRAACGTYASDLEPNNESGLECQIAATQQRIKQFNKLLTSN